MASEGTIVAYTFRSCSELRLLEVGYVNTRISEREVIFLYEASSHVDTYIYIYVHIYIYIYDCFTVTFPSTTLFCAQALQTVKNRAPITFKKTSEIAAKWPWRVWLESRETLGCIGLGCWLAG